LDKTTRGVARTRAGLIRRNLAATPINAVFRLGSPNRLATQTKAATQTSGPATQTSATQNKPATQTSGPATPSKAATQTSGLATQTSGVATQNKPATQTRAAIRSTTSDHPAGTAAAKAMTRAIARGAVTANP